MSTFFDSFLGEKSYFLQMTVCNCDKMTMNNRTKTVKTAIYLTYPQGKAGSVMLDIFREEWVVTTFMLTFLVLSIFMRVMLGMLYRNMIKAADNMATTRNKLLKQCKLKFANCYQLNNGVANIPVFVDKFLNRLAIGPFSFETVHHLSGQMMLLSVVSAGVGICRSILRGKMLGEILPFYIVSFVGLYLYFSVSSVVDVKGKRRMLKINLAILFYIGTGRIEAAFPQQLRHSRRSVLH